MSAVRQQEGGTLSRQPGLGADHQTNCLEAGIAGAAPAMSGSVGATVTVGVGDRTIIILHSCKFFACKKVHYKEAGSETGLRGNSMPLVGYYMPRCRGEMGNTFK
jgi:hypothetical protein